MNKRQKEVAQQQLNNEKAVLKKLEKNYKDALDEINSKIEILLARQDADMQHVIYQVEYQRALKTQVQAILEQLQSNEFETLSEYLTQAYEDGFIGTMYDLQGWGIPLIMPLDQEQIVAAIQHETRLSAPLYTALGKDIADLRKQIAGEISRGIAVGAMYSEIARNIAGYARIPRNNAMRIARTEAHRIQSKATMDACYKAKSKGADVVKIWDSALDAKTRDSHRELDGQVRELDEPFEVNGHKAMYPGGFGRPEEDINCRCSLLQQARWLLGKNYTKWGAKEPVVISDDGTTQFAYIDAKNYKEFQAKYKQATKRVRGNVQKMKAEKALEKNGKSSKIELEEIIIRKGVGAKAKNYKVQLPDGEQVEFTEGTRITNIKTIAGKGRDRQIDEVDILVDKYGGTAEEWQKKKGFGYLDYEGESYKAEVHWYEEPTVGRVKFKAKSYEGEWIIDDE